MIANPPATEFDGHSTKGGPALSEPWTQPQWYKFRMIGFEVSINGKRACLAGVDSGKGVLSATVTWG